MRPGAVFRGPGAAISAKRTPVDYGNVHRNTAETHEENDTIHADMKVILLTKVCSFQMVI